MRPVAVGIEINYREPGMLCTTTRMRKEGKRITVVEVWVARGDDGYPGAPHDRRVYSGASGRRAFHPMRIGNQRRERACRHGRKSTLSGSRRSTRS